MRNRIRQNQGFTLIELVVAVTILGILAASATVRYADVAKQAHNSVMLSFAKNYASSVDLLHSSWVAKSHPSSIVSHGRTINFSATGWPGGGTLTPSTCQQLLPDIFDNPPPSVPDGTTPPLGSKTLQVFGFTETCIYILAQQPNDSTLRAMIYNVRKGDVVPYII